MCKVRTVDGCPAVKLQNGQRYTSGAKRFKSLSIAFMTDFSFISLSF
jgi:hypothetical protein